ncbi:MAG: hypothetical protein WED10_00865, partial [Brumimicrobium sp.]
MTHSIRNVDINLITQKYDFSEKKPNGPCSKNEIDYTELYSQNKFYEFHFPAIVSNSIIEFDRNPSFKDLKKILLLIEGLTCKHIVIIFNYKINLQSLDDLFSFIQKRTICEFTLISNFSKEVYTDSFVEKLSLTNRYKNLVFYNSPFNKVLEGFIFYLKSGREPKFNKHINEFKPNWVLFSESQNHHTYFNRKLYIGTKGEIKNAPESDEIFGSIHDINNSKELKEIVRQLAFQKHWLVHKEITDVCKNCEFRHMCVDNRLPYQRSKNEWYHKHECNYNPY